VRVLGGIRDVAAPAWDALVGDGSPFLEWEWLACLEDAGTVRPETGWLPQHLTLWEGERLLGACPLYVKSHSMGEFVFDQGWAAAAERVGIAYYPKLLVGVPFTPVTGRRFLARRGDEGRVARTLGAMLERVATDQELSSVHVNFCLPPEAAVLEERGWLRRTAWQYHWLNAGYATFDDYLAALRSKRRNQTRRERRALAEQGVTITGWVGGEIPERLLGGLHRFYRATIDDNPWGRPYLNEEFFRLAATRLRSRLCLIVAERAGEPIAATINVQKGDALYGRYWGALTSLRHLHFNVCYYAAIEHCITHGLARFEPGAGGEFKHLRGFEATETRSLHFVVDPRFRAAVEDFLGRERAAVRQEITWYGKQSALRRDRRSSE
jgi:predicted N-acyltransferase